MRSHFRLSTPLAEPAAPSVGTKGMQSHFSLASRAAMTCALSGAAAMMTNVCSAGFSAADYATNSTYAAGWSAGQNGGFGFGAWSFNGTDPAGAPFQAMSSGSAIGTAWTLFNTNNSSGTANAGRGITGGLMAGQTFETTIQNPATNIFYRGFDILFINGTDNKAPGDNTSAIRLDVFNYGTQFWNVNGAATTISAPTSAAAGMRIDLMLTSASTYSVTLTPLNGASAFTLGGTFVGPINYVDFREWDAASSGPTDSAHNFGISYLTVVPEPSTLALYALGSAGLLFLRRRK